LGLPLAIPATAGIAAIRFAAELGQDLWEVDQSCVVSKCIGETEKNLAVAFVDSERAGAALFYDEADRILARRTDLGDAHDRYTNLETDYRLRAGFGQRIRPRSIQWAMVRMRL